MPVAVDTLVTCRNIRLKTPNTGKHTIASVQYVQKTSANSAQTHMTAQPIKKEKIHFSETINAPKEKVWDTMFQDITYRQWTIPFSEGSHFKGDWSKGSKILFLGPNPENGKEGGMVSRIAENKPYEFMSVEHLGIVQDGVEDTTSEEATKWAPAFENYTFREKDGQTEVLVDMDITSDYKEAFQSMWPNALRKLKELAEK